MNIGDQAPAFSLPDTDGGEHGPDGVTAVVFTCNHCPYALGWHDRLLQLARDYDGRHLPRDQPQRRRSATRRTRTRRWGAGASRRRLADALPARREPGSGPRI